MTSKRMLVNGLGGYFLMLSGSALHIKNQTIDNFFELPVVRVL